jgi:hypothetical protein
MVMIDVAIEYINPARVLEIVQELRDMGWVQGTDFDFAFHQSKWDEMIGEIPRHTVFTFYNDSNASYFMLRWS